MTHSKFQNTHLVVMAGGIGTRYWPFSRKKFPKQFHDLLGIRKSLLQTTVERFKTIVLPENIWVVTHAPYADIVKKQLPYINKNQILSEPDIKNTAPCMAYVSYKIAVQYPNAQVIFSPADHVITHKKHFVQSIEQALSATAQTNYLAILGVPCTHAATGYGYIEFDEQDLGIVKKIVRFTEKPSQQKAATYLTKKKIVWNTGIFISKVNSLIQSYRIHLPEMYGAFEKGKECLNTPEEKKWLVNTYRKLPNLSFDYGILEKTKNTVVVVNELGWSDLGTWDALYTYLPKDKQANVRQGNIVAIDTKKCMIKSTGNTLIATYGIEDLVIAQHENVIMICQKQDAQHIKTLVNHVKTRKGKDYV